MPSEHWNGLPYDSTLGDAFDYEPPLSVSNQWRLFHKTDRQIVQEALDLLRTVSKDDVTLLKARNYLIEWKVNH